MRAGGRLAVAGASAMLGMFLTWGLLRAMRIDPPPVGSPAVLRSRMAPVTAATLWVLAIGVSQYRDPALNLRYAESDARSIAAALSNQQGTGLYSAVHTRVLANDAVTRESILTAVEDLLGRASPEDVVLIFLAGHGIRDQVTGSYYFLPYPASPENLRTAGLRLNDFDEVIRVLRRCVRATVLMLDTCHAGAAQLSQTLFQVDPLAAGVTGGDGFYMIAASRPGEVSQELPELAHGVFTAAFLDALRGGADGDGNGVLSISEIFGRVATEVPRLTDGQQHPYHRMEGTDLAFASVEVLQIATRSASHLVSPIVSVPVVANTIGVMEFHNLRGGGEHDWVGKALRVAFNTELSKVRALRVYAPALLDRIAMARGLDDLSTAQQLRIGKLITGSFHVVGPNIRIDAQIIDTTTGVQQSSDSVEGKLDEFLNLQKKLVLSILQRLPVQVLAAEGESIQEQTNTDVDAYRLLLEAEGMVEPTPLARGENEQPAVLPQSRWFDRLSPRTAFAQPLVAGTETAVAAVLESYRKALESKDIDALAALYVDFGEPQRNANIAYLQNAEGLRVHLSDLEVEPHGDGIALTFTRRDKFTDRQSGRQVRLEVRITKVLVQKNGQWKIGK